MAGTTKQPELKLDIFGQRLVTIFTQIAFCYPLPDTIEFQTVVTNLQQGLSILSRAFPWVAGQVVCRNASPTSTGVFAIAPLEPTPRFYTKDLTTDAEIKSMAELRDLKFPMSALEERTIAPRNSYSGKPGETTAEVFQVQANRIRGGLVLTFLGQHQAMDGIGLATVLGLLDKACRGEVFTQEDVRSGNLEREGVVPLLGESWTPGPELEYNIVNDSDSQDAVGHPEVVMPADKGVWRHFHLSASAITALKSHVQASLPATTPYISSDDAITALVWHSISKARAPRFDTTTTTRLARAFDLRRHLDIPQGYPGMIQSMTYHAFPLSQLSSSELGPLAADLRAALDPERLAYYGRSFGTLIARTPDRTKTSLLAGFEMGRDVMINSWANQKVYGLDFGLGLGGPEAVRRPHFEGFQGLVYLLPKSGSGDVGLAVCLSEVDMERLKADDEFGRWATCIG